MDYHYESLDAQRFQKLCQAIIVAQYPNAQCLPVGQPDGGRDAFAPTGTSAIEGYVIFQVKFSSDPKSKTEREAIREYVKTEKSKVKKLVDKGAKKYFLLTNIPGTAHLDTGSIDKTNRELSDELGVNAEVWWRDDLDRRLENAAQIKLSYLEILKASDVLPLLLQGGEGAGKNRAARALRGYLATQYESDKDVKFKQVDLKRRLTELFVDLPIGNKRPTGERRFRREYRMGNPVDMNAYIRLLDSYDEYEEQPEANDNHAGLAAAFLLQMPMEKGVGRFVLEGAPGQGKSTVTQYLCQVNRLRLLDPATELASIPEEHKIGQPRTPFRADLRDYATWLTGGNPYARVGEPVGQAEERRSLENFLVMQVAMTSGGLSISQDDLMQMLAHVPSVIVLDGFDEVADIDVRKRIVQEICEASARLDKLAKSVQIIVTSRPAAFANSPGFPEEDWIHLELKDLRYDNIAAYRDKWVTAQGLNRDEVELISRTLDEKLEQPHLRDLARNPMQLAILLHLIHVQGVALPEKRTTLYEEYMKLFFNREAEKSRVVREHRDLLLSIHGVLAWLLHTQAEGGAGPGSITREGLRKEVAKYLDAAGHDPDLASELFTGTVERVGALVSRVEGTFEFEVQPLREYFAARHLYTTAPYSPPGRVRTGTRPERFEALAKNFYWTNVTRFFCGFYDVGELGGLADGISELISDKKYGLINQPRRLALMLLSDQVFAQAPKVMRRLLEIVLEEPGFVRLAYAAPIQRRSEIRLPVRAGGALLLEACKQKLETETHRARSRALRHVIAQNASQSELKDIWTRRYKQEQIKSHPVREAIDLNVIHAFSTEELIALAKADGDFRLQWHASANQFRSIANDSDLCAKAKTSFFGGTLRFPYHQRGEQDQLTGLEVLMRLIYPYSLAILLTDTEEDLALHAVLERYYGPITPNLIEKLEGDSGFAIVEPLRSYALFVVNLMKSDVSEWRAGLNRWSRLVDAGFEEMPGNLLMVRTAVLATLSDSKVREGEWNKQGFSATQGLVKRLYFARQKRTDVNWWRTQLNNATDNTVTVCLAILLSWGAPSVVNELKDEIDPKINDLPYGNWKNLLSMMTILRSILGRRRALIPARWFDEVESLSPRMAIVLLIRVTSRSARRELSKKFLDGYAGKDKNIVLRAWEAEMSGPKKKSGDWGYALRLSRLVHQVELDGPVHSLMPRHIPSAIAEEVLSSTEDHSAELVTACEQQYATLVAQSAEKVLSIANREGWFQSSG